MEPCLGERSRERSKEPESRSLEADQFGEHRANYAVDSKSNQESALGLQWCCIQEDHSLIACVKIGQVTLAPPPTSWLLLHHAPRIRCTISFCAVLAKTSAPIRVLPFFGSRSRVKPSARPSFVTSTSHASKRNRSGRTIARAARGSCGWLAVIFLSSHHRMIWSSSKAPTPLSRCAIW